MATQILQKMYNLQVTMFSCLSHSDPSNASLQQSADVNHREAPPPSAVTGTQCVCVVRLSVGESVNAGMPSYICSSFIQISFTEVLLLLLCRVSVGVKCSLFVCFIA